MPGESTLASEEGLAFQEAVAKRRQGADRQGADNGEMTELREEMLMVSPTPAEKSRTPEKTAALKLLVDGKAF